MPSGHGAKLSERSLKGPFAVQVLDEAVAFLRRTPLSIFVIYYAGTLPFSLALIYFVFDMTQSAFAENHLALEAFLLTVFYFWMKTCQAVFSRRLLASLEGGDTEPWNFRRWANTALLQAIYAGTFVIVYPVGLQMLLPFGWVNAFYHNVSIVATGAKSTLRGSFAEAASLSAYWPKQNHLILAILLGVLAILFLDIAVFLSVIPQLLSMFLGVSTEFNENASAWNNSSFYVDVGVFCFLVLNPLNKAIYVLRCFYGRARFDGADLLAELRRQRTLRQVQAAAAAVVFGGLLILSQTAQADAPTPAAPATAPATASTVSDKANLNSAIEKTLQKDEFAWRLPRPVEATGEESWITKTIKKLRHLLWKALEAVMKPLVKFLRWLFGSSKSHDVDLSGVKTASSLPWGTFFIIVLILALAFLAWLIFRNFRRQSLLPGAAANVITPIKTVDLESESVRADQLPEDSWLAMAQELLEKGETRLALRALYLATLSLLAHRQLIRLGPAKSNRDYLQEFTRRLRGDGNTVPPFRDNIRLFEASWYGTHAATLAIIEAMRANHHNLREHVPA